MNAKTKNYILEGYTMTIRIYYRRKDFFGKIVDGEDTIEPMTADDAKKALAKCFSAVKENSLCAFRVEFSDELYLVECKLGDVQNGVFTVTRCYGRNTDEPQKMTAAAIRRIALSAVESCAA